MKLAVRDMKHEDIDSVANYFVNAGNDFLRGMDMLAAKILPLDSWRTMLSSGLEQPYEERAFHFVIWEADGKGIGHSNVNKMTYGEEAWMHVHIWKPDSRRLGYSSYFIKNSVDRYFNLFDLKKLHCEPYALNPTPNDILPKAGFEFMRFPLSIPDKPEIAQAASSWSLSREKWIFMKERNSYLGAL